MIFLSLVTSVVSVSTSSANADMITLMSISPVLSVKLTGTSVFNVLVWLPMWTYEPDLSNTGTSAPFPVWMVLLLNRYAQTPEKSPLGVAVSVAMPSILLLVTTIPYSASLSFPVTKVTLGIRASATQITL